MPADEVPPSRAFMTATQSLQHLETNARLGDAHHPAGTSQEATTKVYQQAPREDDEDAMASAQAGPPRKM